jgi:hypothetical protein
MGIFIAKPDLDEAETATWQRLANRTQGNRAVGGRLYLTATRLLFEPNRVDARTGGHQWTAPLADIIAVGTEPRDGNPMSGGLRERLRLTLADGSAELFVISHLGEVIRVLRDAVTHARHDRPSSPPGHSD